MLGFDARYEAHSENTDIRQILEESVNKHRSKFYLSLTLFAPIMVLIWILPFVKPSWVTALNLLNGVPLYVYLTAGFSTIIQLVMGSSFYISAFNSLRHYSANMDVLVMLGTTAAWGYGLVLIGVGYSDEERTQSHFQM